MIQIIFNNTIEDINPNNQDIIDHGNLRLDLDPYTQYFITVPQTLKLTHNAINTLDEIKFYIRPAGFEDNYDYTADFTGFIDFTKMLELGDLNYGYQINQDFQNSFPDNQWTSFKTGSGDTQATGIALSEKAFPIGSVTPDIITGFVPFPVGLIATIQHRFIIPITEKEAGFRQIGLRAVFKYVS